MSASTQSTAPRSPARVAGRRKRAPEIVGVVELSESARAAGYTEPVFPRHPDDQWTHLLVHVGKVRAPGPAPGEQPREPGSYKIVRAFLYHNGALLDCAFGDYESTRSDDLDLLETWMRSWLDSSDHARRARLRDMLAAQDRAAARESGAAS